MRQRNFFFFQNYFTRKFLFLKKRKKTSLNSAWLPRYEMSRNNCYFAFLSFSFSRSSLNSIFWRKMKSLISCAIFFSVRGSACLSWSRQNIFTRRYRPYAGTQKTAYQWWSSETTIPPSTRSDNNSIVRWSPSRLLADCHCYRAMNLPGNLPLPPPPIYQHFVRFPRERIKKWSIVPGQLFH